MPQATANTKKRAQGAQTRASQQALEGLAYQLLETEMGGVAVYSAAVQCATNEEFRTELDKYMDQTIRHVAIARQLLEQLGLDPDARVPARQPVHLIALALVHAIEAAQRSGTPDEAQITAAECVVQAETKDHANWSLATMLSKQLTGPAAQALAAACEQVEKEEDHHLYHSMGWARELWIASLGLPAVLPPPEEERDVESMAAAARAKATREPKA
jgi:hypothetical protein